MSWDGRVTVYSSIGVWKPFSAFCHVSALFIEIPLCNEGPRQN